MCQQGLAVVGGRRSWAHGRIRSRWVHAANMQTGQCCYSFNLAQASFANLPLTPSVATTVVILGIVDDERGCATISKHNIPRDVPYQTSCHHPSGSCLWLQHRRHGALNACVLPIRSRMHNMLPDLATESMEAESGACQMLLAPLLTGDVAIVTQF